jgi:hypothetical protein
MPSSSLPVATNPKAFGDERAKKIQKKIFSNGAGDEMFELFVNRTAPRASKIINGFFLMRKGRFK